MVVAVVFDLFGTLVGAPTPAERTAAVAALARAAESSATVIERYLADSWMSRHNGELSTVTDLGHHLAKQVGHDCADQVSATWRNLATPRLRPDRSIVRTLKQLRRDGLRLGLLSDASAEIAEAWPHSQLSELIDHAVFSGTANALKPAPRLYREVLDGLGVGAHATIYVGDGGGDELCGANRIGMRAVRVARRGGVGAIAYGDKHPWSGPALGAAESVPAYLGGRV